MFSVPLPSRRQSCEFTMKPVTHTVGKFLSFLKEEDGGIDRAAIFTEGKRMICSFIKFCRICRIFNIRVTALDIYIFKFFYIKKSK